ncbi:MAG: DUF2274 domain-containing protein [Sphingobium sp.]|jgi:hypothetical protein|nr:DUF2274 domain-containing protein [Sphingomonadaceae bacterium]MBP9156612.1 DUF2274 domain-containing protein [Sphingobium sp.]MCH4152822.1 DUF2274 domain-containing protein [Sphingobium sp.]MCI1271816.1 DUF2274 domain-containing protein [Sphingobium sp.]MCI1756178.1 DUF2274 domain-containing protein [Sphingobium sp.]
MTRLRLGPIAQDKPVRLSVELPASVHHDLVAYANALAAESGATALAADRLVAPMLARFMATDRGFAKLRRQSGSKERA